MLNEDQVAGLLLLLADCRVQIAKDDMQIAALTARIAELESQNRESEPENA